MNIPFELIFVILFFVLPALGSLQKRLRERGQGEQKNAERPDPSSGRRPSAPVAPPQANTSQQPASMNTPTPSTNPGELGGWLEEAQRRVREAREAEAQGRRGGQTGRSTVAPRQTSQQTSRQTSQPAQRGSVSRPQSAQPRAGQPRSAPPRTPPRSLEGRSLEGGSLESARPERAAGSTNPDNVTLSTAPPLRVQRLQGAGRATMGQRVRLDGESVMNGFIWHQVLSPPLSKRRRTRLSRRQP